MASAASNRVNPRLTRRGRSLQATIQRSMHGRLWPGSGPHHKFDHVPPAKFQEPALNAPSTPQITLYTSAVCGYCVAAKNFLKSRGLEWSEVRIDTDPAEREKMVALARRTSVDRKSVGKGKGVAVRVDLGGRRNSNK